MIKFYSKRYVFLIISLSVLVIGIIAAFVNGINLDIEFKGGSILKYQYVGDIDVKKADDAISNAINGRIADCQTTTDLATGTKKLVVSLAGNEGLSAQDQDALDKALKAQFPDAQLSQTDANVVEPLIGKTFLKRGITAIILSFLLMVLYVWYSFRKIGGLSAGCMAMVALIHDVIVVFIAFIVFRIPINQQFIAAALVIIGFSINDTIVIYDRIRENTIASRGKMSTEELVDLSITQSISRSVNTNLATFASITMVFIFAKAFGIDSIVSFALPMMFGVISGCYSTICIAGPLYVAWKNRKKKKLVAVKQHG